VRVQDQVTVTRAMKVIRGNGPVMAGPGTTGPHLEFGNRLRKYFPKIANHCLYHI
jgi:hypothetical protein